MVKVIVEAKKDGRCYEIGSNDFRCQFGRVLAIDPPNHLTFTWQIGARSQPQPDPSNASEIEVYFNANGDSSTTVLFKHHFIGRHGTEKEAKAYYETLNSEQSWSWVLAHYQRKAGRDI